MNTHPTRRQALKTLAGAALGTAALGRWPVRAQAGPDPSSPKPNFLVIWADDLRQTTRAWGDDFTITPNLDRFLDGATVYRNAFCNFPVCGPSRNCCLGGIRPTKSGMISNGAESLRRDHPWVVTFPELLKNNGYETFGMGKIYHHDQDVEKSWTKYFHYPATIQGYQNRPVGGKGDFTEFVPNAEDGYPDGWLADTVLDLFKNKSDKPFLTMVGLQKPHLPFVAPQKYWDLYENVDIPDPQEPYFPEGMPDIENTNCYELRMFRDVPKGTEPFPPELKKKIRRGYYACVSFIDAQVGRILDGLKAAGLDQTTNVILMADHGWQLGENNLWCKDELFDHSLRPIFATRFPGLPAAPKQVDHFVELVDLYPTLCAMTGVKAPYALDGKDFTPLLTGGDAPWEDVAYAAVNRQNKVIGFTVRRGPLRYCLWLDQKTKEVRGEELYDFSLAQPGKVNLATDPGYSAPRGELHALVQRQVDQAVVFGVDLPEQKA
jgi:arylsulfatase A-like enzyme